MKLAIFGGAGTVGSVLLDRSLALGYSVHALCRTQIKRKPDPHLTVSIGDALHEDAVDRVIAGSDAVLSTLGGVRGPQSLSTGTDLITRAMQRHGIARLIILQGFHLPFPGDYLNFGQRLIGPIMHMYNKDIVRHGKLMADSLRRNERLDWTVVRIPRIAGSATAGDYRSGRLKLGPWSKVSSVDAAQFMLDCLDRHLFIRQAPMVASR